MVGLGGNRKRPYEMEEPRLMEEIAFPTIPRNSLVDAPIILEVTIEGFRVRRIYMDGGSSSKIMYEHYFKSFDVGTKSKLRKSNAHLVGFSGEIYHPLGLIDLKVTMGEPGKNKTMLLEFAIVKCHSPYNVILGRTRMRSLSATDRGNAKFMERNAMAPAHGADVEDNGTCYLAKSKHGRTKGLKGAYGSRRILGRRHEANGGPPKEHGRVRLGTNDNHMNGYQEKDKNKDETGQNRARE
ncbi:hypothetical protein Tco_0664583 [Tanacetum coccineum]